MTDWEGGGRSLVDPQPLEEDGDDIKDSWDDPDPEPEPEPEKPAPKPAKSKAKKAAANAAEYDLSEIEKQKRQLESDLENARDMMGVSGGIPIDDDEDRKATSTKLKDIISSASDSEKYDDFLSQLFKDLCFTMQSDSVKRFGKELTLLGQELQKQEKEQNKPKSKKKHNINIGTKGERTGNLDAIVDADDMGLGGGGSGGAGYDDFDEDFM